MTDLNLTMHSNRMKAAARIRDLEIELAEARAEAAKWKREREDFAEAFHSECDQNKHLRAQIAAWEQAAATYFMIDAKGAYAHLLSLSPDEVRAVGVGCWPNEKEPYLR